MKRSTFFCSRLLIILAFLTLKNLAFSQTIGSPGTTVTAKGDFAVDSAFKARRIQAIIDREVDTSFTIPGTTSAVVLDTIAADRTVTFPSLPLTKKGTVLFVYNGNSSAFQWNVSGPVYQGNGVAITSLPRDGYIFQWDGGKWVLFSTSGGSGSISGDTLVFDAPLTQSGKHVGLDYNLLPQDTVQYKIYGDSLYQINYYGARGSTPAYRDSVAILGPADATHAGLVNTSAQTFAGNKIFTGQIRLTLTGQTDTTTYKPMAVNSSGDVYKLDRWPGSGGGSYSISFDSLGTGEASLISENDVLRTRRFKNTYGLNWDTATDRSIRGTIDTNLITSVLRLRKVADSLGALIGAGGGGGWNLTGNSIASDSTFGTTNAAGIKFITNNTTRMVLGQAGRLWYNASGPGLWNWNINDTAQFQSVKIGNPTIPANSIRSLAIKGASTQSIDYAIYAENSAGTRVFSVTNAGDLSGTIWGALNSTTYRFSGTTGTFGITNGGGTNGNLFSFVPLSTTTAVGATNTPIVRVQMKLTTTAASNTGYYAGMLIDGANDESAGSTTPVYGAVINPTNTSVTNYTGLMVGTPEVKPSALVNLNSTTQGFLPPRMTGAQAEAISSPAEGLLVYCNNGNGTTITTTGWWGYNGTTWVKLN